MDFWINCVFLPQYDFNHHIFDTRRNHIIPRLTLLFLTKTMKHYSLRSLLRRPNLSLLCTIIISLAHLLEMFYYAQRILSYSQFSHIENEGRFLANDADARAWYYIKLIFFSFCHFSLRRKGVCCNRINSN